MLEQLIHNGVAVPEPHEPRGLVLTIRGRPVALTPAQEEMALAWAKKQGTPYVEDRTFVRNFLADFSRELGYDPPLTLEEIDFGPAIRLVEEEKEARARMSREERKELAARRKAQREALRERYGYVIVNGERVELANYIVEPSGIFMGRGDHPLRGRWKPGPRQSDITLNLSPDAPRPPGEWAAIVWEPDALWVARWQDKLSGKMKYVWLGDTAPIKQAREAQKFDQAHELEANLQIVREQIARDLDAADPKRRMLATVCYLIDALCMRVGDEKDPDEADTVGATTLRPEQVRLHPDGTAEFRFLGKDSVLWHKKIALPDAVRRNLAERIAEARPPANAKNPGKRHPTREKPQLFPDISSRDVNAYLSSIVPGLTAKVFRTHHATMAVARSLATSGVGAEDPEYVKWKAASLANLEAAILCNHTKKAPANWAASRKRMEEQQARAQEHCRRLQEKVRAAEQALAALRREAREKVAAAPPARRTALRERYEARLETATRKLALARQQLERARLALGRVRAQAEIAAKKRTWNLTTSLKSYIDPRVFTCWGEQVGYDVLEKYYPKTLRRRFAWAKGYPVPSPWPSEAPTPVPSGEIATGASTEEA